MNPLRFIFRKCSFAAAALLAAEASFSSFAESALITASSVYDDSYRAEFAFDGDLNTRWASGGQARLPAWLQFDLGSVMAFDRIVIHWETACATEYEIQTSETGTAWRTVLRKTGGQAGKTEFSGLAARGRFVRISALKPKGFSHVSIWEVEFPESHVVAVLTSARQATAEKRARQMRETLARITQSGAKEIVFAARRVVGEHWYANFGYYAAASKKPYFGTEKLYRDGAKLYRLNLENRQLATLLDDPQGGIRDPQVHYDGRKILFAYRQGGTENFHLYEINCDGSGLRQLTDGPFDDIEPSYLPDGGIVFVSSRAKRWVNCWTTQVAVLHRCDADGRNIRDLSSNNEHDNTPWPLPDGRILYTRWEYVDRSQVHYHHLWTANPDGTGQTVYFGNLHPGVVMIDAKPIPGTEKIVASFSPGHGQTEHAGWIAVVDPKGGPDAQSFAKRITAGQDFCDPWALSEDCFLAARGSSIVLVDGSGNALELGQLPAADIKAGLLAHEPRPMAARERERVIPARANPAEPTGRFVLANVYDGRNMAGVKPGEIKKLLVLETLPKPINFTGGMEPLSYGGTFTLERILGTVPVEADGSACFEAPALRSLFFVALDEKDLAVKRMQSFTTLMPGETTGCVGCHEHRVKPPAWDNRRRLLALAREPSRLTPISDVPEVLDFPRDVQPILDRHCLKCHDCDQRQGGVVLSGDRGPHYSLSYFTLTARDQLADGRNRAISSYAPRKLGSGGSALMAKLEPAHHDVKLSPLEKKTVRLWIDIGAPYPGTYAALGCGMIGGYDQNTLDRSAEAWPSTQTAMESIRRRCASCHTGLRTLPVSVCDEIVAPPWEDMSPHDPRRRFSRHLLYNLTRPEKSPLLLAALAKEAGGLALCRADKENTNSVVAVFKTTADPDYVKMLAAIAEAKKQLEEIKRFDMPGFRPRPEWVREMKRYGVLPAESSDRDPLDVYAVEKRYWQSLWPKLDAVVHR
ncbi:MAG: discoidin domain-containing protein [Verrucomicrobia bacterium]|nr:discoidin domain-containing protein [Verrucomicrobiota bacterium]